MWCEQHVLQRCLVINAKRAASDVLVRVRPLQQQQQQLQQQKRCAASIASLPCYSQHYYLKRSRPVAAAVLHTRVDIARNWRTEESQRCCFVACSLHEHDYRQSTNSDIIISVHSWFLPRCMQCRHCLAMRILFVCLSVKRAICDSKKVKSFKGLLGGADLRFVALSQTPSLRCEATNTGLVYRAACLFTPQLSPVPSYTAVTK